MADITTAPATRRPRCLGGENRFRASQQGTALSDMSRLVNILVELVWPARAQPPFGLAFKYDRSLAPSPTCFPQVALADRAALSDAIREGRHFQHPCARWRRAR
jgi:hypothetical protein